MHVSTGAGKVTVQETPASPDSESNNSAQYPGFWELAKSVAYHPATRVLAPVILIGFALQESKHPMLTVATVYIAVANRCVNAFQGST